jgi:hypothetical protein
MNDFVDILFTTLYAGFEASKVHVRCCWKNPSCASDINW